MERFVKRKSVISDPSEAPDKSPEEARDERGNTDYRRQRDEAFLAQMTEGDDEEYVPDLEKGTGEEEEDEGETEEEEEEKNEMTTVLRNVRKDNDNFTCPEFNSASMTLNLAWVDHQKELTHVRQWMKGWKCVADNSTGSMKKFFDLLKNTYAGILDELIETDQHLLDIAAKAGEESMDEGKMNLVRRMGEKTLTK